MVPVSPVVPGNQEFEVIYAEKQPEYSPLPALRTEKSMLTRWHLSAEERAHIANGGDLFICCLTFGQPPYPILPIAATPARALEIMIETESST
jgi:hypothetical protein